MYGTWVSELEYIFLMVFFLTICKIKKQLHTYLFMLSNNNFNIHRQRSEVLTNI